MARVKALGQLAFLIGGIALAGYLQSVILFLVVYITFCNLPSPRGE